MHQYRPNYLFKTFRKGFALIALLFFMGTLMGAKTGSASFKDKVLAYPAKPLINQLLLNEQFGRLPLSFEPNLGQFDPQVKFFCRGGGYSLFITPAEAVLVLKSPARSPEAEPSRHASGFSLPTVDRQLPTVASDVVRLRLVGGNRLCQMEGLEKLPGISNYFIDNDPSKWRTKVPQYAKAKLKEVYPGIDMVYYGTHGRLEYDFVVKPGGDPKQICIKVDGADEVQIDGKGSLQLTIGGGRVVFKAPVIYQQGQGRKKPIEGRYIKAGGKTFGFEVEKYDATKSLVIDPMLEYSTYLGGIGSDEGYKITTDSSGNAYITGWTDGSFPVTPGSYQTAFGGNTDAYVSKLNSTGTALIYSTYLGGSGNDYGYGIAVDSSGNAFITGITSGNFPTTPGAYQTTFGGGQNAFVTELDITGSALVYSTYLGGNYVTYAEDIAVDSSGNAYVTGFTYGNFPTTPGAFQATHSSGTNFDAFVAKLSPAGSSLLYSTYLGGSTDDYGYGITVDNSGNIYVAGTTNGDFPTTSGAYQTTFAGVYLDAFITKIDPAGNGTGDLIYSTYLGGNGNDTGLCIEVDSGGDAYVIGNTMSANFPTTPGAYRTVSSGGFGVAYMAKINPTGSALLYSTYVTGDAWGMALDSSGIVYLTGGTSGSLLTTSDAYQTTYGGGSYDAYVVMLNPNGNGTADLVYSTFLGGSGWDRGRDIAVDLSGNIYITGHSDSNFPTTPGAFQTAFGGGGQDAFLVKFAVLPSATPTSTPTFGSTASHTPTIIMTSTATYSPTVFATSTPTITPTLTWTTTTTSTPAITDTPTPTPSVMATATPTLTWSQTITLTSTQTPSPTSTPTIPSGCEMFYISKNVFNSGVEPVSIFVATSKYPGPYSLRVYNTAGECVKVLGRGELTAPFQHSYLWEGENQYSEKCASGMYIIYLVEPFGTRLARVLLIR